LIGGVAVADNKRGPDGASDASESDVVRASEPVDALVEGKRGTR
jgi:hypothetical protein